MYPHGCPWYAKKARISQDGRSHSARSTLKEPAKGSFFFNGLFVCGAGGMIVDS